MGVYEGESITVQEKAACNFLISFKMLSFAMSSIGNNFVIIGLHIVMSRNGL